MKCGHTFLFSPCEMNMILCPFQSCCYSVCFDRDVSVPGGPCLEESRFLSHLLPGLEHCAMIATTFVSCTEIIGLVFSLERADGQGGRVARPGAGESVRDPRGSTGSTIDEGSGGRSWGSAGTSSHKDPQCCCCFQCRRGGPSDPKSRTRMAAESAQPGPRILEGGVQEMGTRGFRHESRE